MEHARFKPGRDYTLYLPFGYATYSPWFEDWFKEIFSKIKEYTIVTEDRCYILYRLCQHCTHLEGDFAESGVYKGGTAFLIAHVMRRRNVQGKPLHLFDTFTGLPPIADKDPSGLKPGMFGDVNLNDVKDYLQMFSFTVFHPGVMPETFEAVEDRRFAFVHVDVDLYKTAKDCCDFFYSRMVRGGVMIFDNYGFQPYRGAEKRAVDEFFNDKPECPVSLPTGQCLIIKL